MTQGVQEPAPEHGAEPPAARTPSAADRMAAERTELAYQRTRIAADRTLMAIMRTSLSMISFGFTIFSIFRALAENYTIGHAIPDQAPARFGLALVSLGVLLLAAGIVADILYMRTLRSQRQWLVGTGLVDGLTPLPRSLIVVSAILLLLIGLVAIGVILIRL